MKKSVILISVLVAAFLSGCSFDYDDQGCIQVITPMRNTETNECRIFPNPCEVPNSGWVKDNACINESEPDHDGIASN